VRVVGEAELERARGAHIGVLRWRSLEIFDGVTLVEVLPKTGFLHQIRVSLAHLGYPILGDRSYGPASDPIAVPRQMLHAARASWGEVEASSPDPDDFRAALAQCAAPSDRT
jgi:23S rRNA-/tRNA-specific pseudouridylate synthase